MKSKYPKAASLLLLLSLFGGVGLAPALHAEPLPVADGSEEHYSFAGGISQERAAMSISFRLIALKPIREPLYYKDGKKVWSVAPSFREIADPYYINQTRKLQLVRKVISPKGDVTYPVVASYEFPANQRDVWVAILPDGAGSLATYKLWVYDDAESVHPKNSAHFINASPRAVAAQIDGTVYNVEAYGSVTKEILINQAFINAKVAIVVESEAKLLSKARSQIRPGMRMVYFGFPDERKEFNSIYTVIEFRDMGIKPFVAKPAP
jgi:hypothetical protein